MVYQYHCCNLAAAQSPPLILQLNHPRLPRRMPSKDASKSYIEHSLPIKFGVKQAISGLAASLILLSQTNLAIQASATNLTHDNICQLASATDNKSTLTLDNNEENEMMMMMMMRGMTVKSFDPARYAGRWFEVASLKRGFAGQGQEDCHCTQGVYTFDPNAAAIRVDTFCVHGAPDGYITGIRGKVQCLSDEDKNTNETTPEKQAMCYLRFPTLPFIPKQPYDVLATDYDNYALVSGAKDKSFIQIYSRTPNPGPEFIKKYKSNLADFGYDPSKINDTPQDCETTSNSKLEAMMSMPGMEQALTNQFPDLELKSSLALDPFTSVFDTLKKLVQLYFK
ncbi:hypothetical protein CASFOL_025767 [Castilleja foliolosa]|uniref:Lipocalin/cytosolic fatty-acid binding domain-containing protein n=1 Tax=Castilleja foliolosa TaxID=1961234 RepID=A0ABD3CS19_9LAMI